MRLQPLLHRITIALVVGAIIAVVFLMAAPYIVDYMHPGDTMGPIALTRHRMNKLALLIQGYEYEHGVWPSVESWKEQTAKYIKEKTNEVTDDVFTDAWGHSIQYDVSNSARTNIVTLRSRGPNGKDDNGTNDDVVMTVVVPQ
jgi:hypothetical protein